MLCVSVTRCGVSVQCKDVNFVLLVVLHHLSCRSRGGSIGVEHDSRCPPGKLHNHRTSIRSSPGSRLCLLFTKASHKTESVRKAPAAPAAAGYDPKWTFTKSSSTRLASKCGNNGAVVAFLSSCSIDLEHKSATGKTPLVEVCWEGHKRTAELLIREGADVHAKDDADFCCLHAATYQGHLALVDLLLGNGADMRHSMTEGPPRSRWRRSRRSSTRCGFSPGGGTDVHPVAAGGITPLSISCSSASVAPVRILLTELGMNPVTPMNHGCLLQVILGLCQTSPVLESFLQLQATPEALKRRRLDIAELLISSGIDLEVRHLGDSAVHMAAGSGSRRLMVALLRAGASTSSVGKANDNIFGTALSRAAAHSRPEVAHLLLQAGAHENALDQVGRDALCVAGTLVSSMPATPEEELRRRLLAVAHVLHRGPAFRAMSWRWPSAAATTTAATVVEDNGSRTSLPLGALSGLTLIPRHGKRGPRLRAAMWSNDVNEVRDSGT
ncbi:ankyrin repeat protein [Ectocarpus siliculosus]|uniref:Ankyrin repeat protein n=1 Tax=Ectocarpus siliculosus TaxID=2880 RepID=D7FUW9_ECTSI|nr:ankyrin repeat protein [Ectocarpus siliculosus]|eukprot:CBJ31775.1 ankyrin repeat protein [Ectocarpus siliculosus]